MVFKGSKITGSKKKLLGALVIVAFVAFFANVITRYIVVSEVDLTLAAFIAAFVIFALLLVFELQKREGAKSATRVAKRKSRKIARRRRR